MKRTVLVLIMCSFLLGCGNVIKNVPTITATGTIAYQGHDNIVNIVQTNLDIFSPRELVQLKMANEQLISVKVQIDAIIAKKGSPAKLAMCLPDLFPLFQQAQIAYISAHDIIFSKIDLFTRQEQMILYSYEANCSRLGKAVETSMSENNDSQTTREILQFVVMVGKIAIPLLIL